MKYAHTQTDGRIKGWYDKSIHEVIPEPYVEVSDEQWQIAIDNGHNKVNPDGTTEAFDFRTDEEKLSHAKEAKKNEIRNKFKELIDEPIEVNGVKFNGSFDSAIRLDSEKRFCELIGLQTVIFFDYDNVAHEYTMKEAQDIISVVSGDCRSKFMLKQKLMNDIEKLNTVEEIEAIRWVV